MFAWFLMINGFVSEFIEAEYIMPSAIDQWMTRATQKLKSLSARKRALVMSVMIGLLSDLYPIPGFFFAALFFQGGVHTDQPVEYIVTAFAFNFLVFFIVSFSILAFVWRSPTRSN